MITIKKGLDLPLGGNPQQIIHQDFRPATVALLGKDYIGLRPTLLVNTGDNVQKGQALFTDKANPRIRYTSPVSGTVLDVQRGQRRAFQALVIRIGGHDEVQFASHASDRLSTLGRQKIQDQLLESGLWTSLRVRPYSKVAIPDTVPSAIFITAMDTNPLAPNPEVVLKDREQDFIAGMQVLTQLTEGKTFLCKKAGTSLPGENLPQITTAEFSGLHPAGNVGTHIHFLCPVGPTKFVWHIGYQDVLAIGVLFTKGKLDSHRVISLAGTGVKKPRLLKIPLGSNLIELTNAEVTSDQNNRVISGSVLAGHKAYAPNIYLGRYHQQVTVLPEGGEREFLGWLSPGFNKFSVKNVFLSKFLSPKNLLFNTSTNGDPRAMVPIGSYEKVMPLDIESTFLLRALLCRDSDEAQKLGCLELDEEDLALCTYVCPSKYDYGPILRENLERIEKEG